MPNDKIIFPVEFYTQHLKKINGVEFTLREVDVIACILNGRSTKTIPSFLSISPKTVETHIGNIRAKSGCSSRESIIDFIEQSDKIDSIQNHYKQLRVRTEFEKCLKNIAKLVTPSTSQGILYFEEGEQPYLLSSLQTHFKMVGLRLTSEAPETLSHKAPEEFKTHFLLYILSNATVKKLQEGQPTDLILPSVPLTPETILYISLVSQPISDDSKDSKKNENIQYIQAENYYFLVFEILHKLIPSPQIEALFLDFKKQYEQIIELSQDFISHEHLGNTCKEKNISSANSKASSSPQSLICFFKKRNRFLITSFLIFILFSAGGVYLINDKEKKDAGLQQDENSIRSDLSLPTENVFLDRPTLIKQIGEAFKGTPTIQLMALVGGGGAGKTTLARQYARQQTDPLIWEINAETKESLVSSFEVLAQVLAITEEEKKNLKDIQESHSPEVKNNKILLFVKERLKALPSWFLLYDNVESLMDIRFYIPQDEKTWGRGKVLITTRNSHIQSNTYVHTLPVDILTPQEKRALFTKIMDEENVSSQASAQQKETQQLLNELPPFPLDVSIAAYYLKSTHISPETYRQHLHLPNPDFVAVQENILQETGEYLKTRYEIITLSLQELMKIQKDFEDLLLLISFLDSQQIPRALLEKLKDTATVDRFLYQLKKYSLMAYDPPSVLGTSFSLHRSTQRISHAYLMNALNIKADPHRLNSIAEAFKDYLTEIINKKYSQGAETLVRHSKILLSQEGLSPSLRGSLNHLLGRFYCYLGEHRQARDVLQKSIASFEQADSKRGEDFFQAVMTLGNIYREIGQYEEAQHLLEQHLLTYQKNIPKKVDWARGFVYLGQLYQTTGQYKKAEEALTQGIALYEQTPSEDPIGETWAKAHLGVVYQDLGRYQDARALFEQTLSVYKNIFLQITSILRGYCFFWENWMRR